MLWYILVSTIAFFWLAARFVFAGPNLGAYDTPVGEIFSDHADDQQANALFINSLKKVRADAKATRSIKGALGVARKFADNFSGELESDCSFKSVVVEGIDCEWTAAPNVDPRRRVLFLHGGAFIFGTPKGHRIMSHQLSHIANAVVLSVDYRLMPENKRLASCEDAQTVYKWILDNGPEGELPIDFLLVGGDSAGGNLSLMLSSWSKKGASRRPDAVIGFSPSLDSTLASPTFKANRKSDLLLGLPLGKLAALPKTLNLWFGLISMRCKPNNPLISPLFGDLTDLPATLIHASSSEVLLGDAIRYTNLAAEAGSNVRLQIWQEQIHVWHLFNRNRGSGQEAWHQIEKFVAQLKT